MKQIALILFMTCLLLPAYAGKERLIGTWKSNKEATMAYLKTHTKLTQKQLEKVGTVLGTLTVTVDKQTVTYRNGDWKFVSNYRVVEETSKRITIESQNPETKKWERTDLEMDGEGYWVADAKIEGYKERFDKVPK